MKVEKKEEKSKRPIIFIGAPRSGTSVISEIIMRHKDLSFPSQYQARFTNFTGINYLRRIFDNSLWRFYGQKKQLNKVKLINTFVFRPSEAYSMWNKLVPSEVNFGRDFFIGRSADADTRKKISVYFKNLTEYQGKKRLTFKITGPSRIEYLSSIFPNAQFVRIIRDPLAVINSLLKIEFWQSRGKSQLWWTGAYSEEEKSWAKTHKDDAVAMTAFQVKKILDITDSEIRKIKPEIMDIHYSDFVQAPESVISDILDFTGLSRDQACFDYFIENKIYNRNQNTKSNFTEDQLSTINKIFNDNYLIDPER